jgi:hypothetical protein
MKNPFLIVVVLIAVSCSFGATGCTFLEEHGEAISEGIKEIAPLVDIVPSPLSFPIKISLSLLAGIAAYYGGKKGYSKIKGH